MNYNAGKKFHYSEADFLNYEVVGHGSIPIVFLHGFAASLRNWDDVIVHIPRDKFTLYLLDLKGAGLSSKPRDSRYSIKDNAEIVSRFLRENRLRNAILVGHSFGGGVALFVALDALKDPDLGLTRIVLVDAAAYKTELPFFVQYLRIPILRRLVLWIPSSTFKAKYTLRRTFYDRNKITPAIIARYAYFMDQEGYDYALLQTAADILPDEFESYTKRYRDIHAQAIIIWGKNDTALPLSSGEKLVEDLPDASLHVIHDCGHNPHEEFPEKVAELIISSLYMNGE